MDEQVNAIIRNFQDRSKDIQDANRELARAERLFQRQRQRPPTRSPIRPPQRLARNILQGPKGGLYYTSNGKKIYLTPGQCISCENNSLPNVSAGCPPNIIGVCQPTRSELKRSLKRSERKRRSLKQRLRIQSRRRKSCKEKLKNKKQQLRQLRQHQQP